MADFHLNLHVSKWHRHSHRARATAKAGQPVDEVFQQLTGLVDVLKSGELPIEFVRDSVTAFLAEAFGPGDVQRLSRVYGDDTPLGEGWRLHIDGASSAEVARQDALLEDLFCDGERRDGLTRMVRLDQHLNLLD
ncbi:hypothetical protein [Sphingomonas sp. 3-13AW]|uniref:hypothetical protein n=1 Tax=Sphingomonas sp. 3-13AW TaxID=3050450 RepID=UPI003BB7431D